MSAIPDETLNDPAGTRRAGGAAGTAVAAPDLTTAQPRRRASRLDPVPLVVAAILVGILGIWEAASRLELLDKAFFPPPSEIARALPGLFDQPTVTAALRKTGTAMALTAAYSIAAGVLLGYLMGFSRVLRDALLGPALFLLSVPKSIFIPIFMLIFGIHYKTAVIYGTFSGFIYVMVNVVGGFDLIETRHLTVGRAFGAGTVDRIRHIVLPASLPGLFTGIWYGLKNGLEGILIIELFVSVTGLGGVIHNFSDNLQTAQVYAIVFFFSIAAIVLGAAWAAVEHRLTRWRSDRPSAGRR